MGEQGGLNGIASNSRAASKIGNLEPPTGNRQLSIPDDCLTTCSGPDNQDGAILAIMRTKACCVGISRKADVGERVIIGLHKLTITC